MIWRPDDLRADIESYAIRAAVAHEDLLVAIREANGPRSRDWTNLRRDGLNEAAEAVRQHSSAKWIRHFSEAHERYLQTAQRLIGQLALAPPAHDSLDKAWIELKSATATVRKAALRRNLGWRVLGLFAAALLSFFGSVAVGMYQSRQAERESRISRVLQESGECDAEDWKYAGSVTPEDAIQCRVWELELWRTSPAIELRVDAVDGDTLLLRTAVRWLDSRESSTHVVQGQTGPQRTVPLYLCGAQKRARLRLIAWARGSKGSQGVRATAYARSEGESVC